MDSEFFVEDKRNIGNNVLLRKIFLLSQKPERVHTDNPKEVIEACQDLHRNYDTRTPRSSETNGVTERAVRRVQEGTAIACVQSGLPEEWWNCAMECHCYLRNVHDKMADGKTAFEKIHGQKFGGPGIPCGTSFEYIPIITAQDKSRVRPFGKKTLKGTFLGYALRAGRGGSGDLMIADYDLQESEASGIYVKRCKNKEVSAKRRVRNSVCKPEL